MLDEKAFLPHQATEKNITALLPEHHVLQLKGWLAERDPLVLLHFPEEILGELLGDHGAGTAPLHSWHVPPRAAARYKTI